MPGISREALDKLREIMASMLGNARWGVVAVDNNNEILWMSNPVSARPGEVISFTIPGLDEIQVVSL